MSAQFIDRSLMINKLKEHLSINPKRTAIIAIDMHRGHLDPEVATMHVPVDESRKVLENSKKLFALARKYGVPIIHVILQIRQISDHLTEASINPFWNAVETVKETLTPHKRSVIFKHNIVGSVQTEIMPEVAPQKGDYVIDNKKRLSAFYGTDLEILLRTLKVDTLIIVGVNTNTCVLCTAFEAFNRDFKVIIVSDCVASMYGNDLHEFALQNVSRCIGWVLTLSELEDKLKKPSK
ncbi:MAG: cysteine hydrolase [Nitrososphaerota archaeon]|nr:cysteine hydrolase [Candidatus Bathyarchaeota archaeon]MDW8024219.1 cysteine hydrolase [Nitrososphaerota archaeon]